MLECAPCVARRTSLRTFGSRPHPAAGRTCVPDDATQTKPPAAPAVFSCPLEFRLPSEPGAPDGPPTDQRHAAGRRRARLCAEREDQPDRRPAHPRCHAAAAAGTPDPLLPDRRHAGREADRTDARHAAQDHARRGRSTAGGDRAVLDPRPGRGARIRAQATRAAQTLRKHAGDRDARVFREAAHHRRLEGADQRPVPRRELPHPRGLAHRAPTAARHQPPRGAGGQRVPRRDQPAVHRRPDQLGRDRRAHHREPGAPRAGLRACRRRSASRTAPTAT